VPAAVVEVVAVVVAVVVAADNVALLIT
jgi:hypothetical protein